MNFRLTYTHNSSGIEHTRSIEAETLEAAITRLKSGYPDIEISREQYWSGIMGLDVPRRYESGPNRFPDQ